MNDEPFSLKEALFNQDTVTLFAKGIKNAYPAFDLSAFMKMVFDEGWDYRSLLERMHHVTQTLHQHFPDNYRQSLDILLEAQSHLAAGSFVNLVPADFVALYGLDDPDVSIPALEKFTQLGSAEFAVRHFIVKYPERMMAQMLVWAEHEHPEVRRLASEGSRPRLPWGIRLFKLIDDPGPIISILEKLKVDESDSVRRSVANNLNDISKDNPEITIVVLQEWNSNDGEDKRIQWITGHGLRTLVKQGNEDALELLGYPADPKIVVQHVRVEPSEIKLGDQVSVTFEVRSAGNSRKNLMIDYVVYHMKANGKQTPKVFKIKKVPIDPGQVIEVKKNHSFRPVTTRKYYPGVHGIQPQINGKLFKRVDFELTE
jgi:3-methyladenine DNA glycosylase AlkC